MDSLGQYLRLGLSETGLGLFKLGLGLFYIGLGLFHLGLFSYGKKAKKLTKKAINSLKWINKCCK